jgi:hypothetical protein
MVFSSRSRTRFALLPPSRPVTPALFRRVETNSRQHGHLLASMQRLRGRVYEADGAVRRQALTADGRHRLEVDAVSWHVLSLDAQGEVVACLRYVEESAATGFDNLRVRHAAIARCPHRGSGFRRAVEQQMRQSRTTGTHFGEVGGWAVREDYRGTTEALRIVLATYALLELLGSCAGVATATFRHGSESMLRRIGLATLQADGEEIPPYHDPAYGCMMQVLRFDSSCPNPKYQDMICGLMNDLANAPVVFRENLFGVFGRVWRGIEPPDLMPLPASIGG